MKILIAFIAGVLAVGAAITVVAFAGWFPTTATATPPSWEVSLAGRALDGSLEKRSAGLKNPVRPDDATALAVGQELYGDNCSGCHGDATGPSKWGTTGFYPRVPQFYQLRESELTPGEAYAAIHDGIRYTGMGGWSGMMKEEDIWKVANFVARIHHVPPQQEGKPAQ